MNPVTVRYVKNYNILALPPAVCKGDGNTTVPDYISAQNPLRPGIIHMGNHGLYGPGMHDFIIREIEIGTRATMAEDSDACGYSALFDLSYEMYIANEDKVNDN